MEDCIEILYTDISSVTRRNLKVIRVKSNGCPSSSVGPEISREM